MPPRSSTRSKSAVPSAKLVRLSSPYGRGKSRGSRGQVPIVVHAHEPDTIYVVPIKSDSEHFPPEGKFARVPQPDGRKRVGRAHERSAAKRLLRQRAPQRHDR